MRAPDPTGPAGDELLVCDRPRAGRSSATSSPASAGFSALQLRCRPARGGQSRVSGALVTGGYYETLGLSPAAGRLLAPADDEPGAPLVAVISDGYWERQFARQHGRGRTDAPHQRRAGDDRRRQPARLRQARPSVSIADITLTRGDLAASDAERGAAPRAGQLLAARPGAAGSPVSRSQQATARLNAVWPRFADSRDRGALAGVAAAGDRRARSTNLAQGAPGGRICARSTASRSTC